jgi:transcriptional regulator with XRE-family HTH domain
MSQVARIQALQAAGLSDVAIATKLQIGLMTVRRALTPNPVVVPPPPKRPPLEPFRRNIAAIHGPSPVDVQVGRQVRLYRTVAGLSQTQLADAIGLTFQQIQKYERGSNRISASKLVRIADVLGTPVPAFFEGAEDSPPTPRDRIMLRREAIELSRAYERIANPKLRDGLMELFRTLGEQLPGPPPKPPKEAAAERPPRPAPEGAARPARQRPAREA